MDKEEILQNQKCIPSENALHNTVEQRSKFFKEPEGMTTISLNDVTIPAESKSQYF